MIIIANPLFDVVFKGMMENERIARHIIGTLLNVKVISIKVKSQELTYKSKRAGLSVFRLDFIATIQTESGDLINVLIEIQKAKNDVDVMRFRNYVAAQYRREDIVDAKSVPLPIITIYILGFNLEELPLAFTEIKRQYRDGLSKTPVTYKSKFVENLSHDTYVVQAGRINGKHRTKTEKLLSIFEQTNFVGEGKIRKKYYYKPNSEEEKILTKYLHEVGCDSKEIKKIKVEEEAWRSTDALFASKEEKFQETLKKKNEALVEKDKALVKKDKALVKKDKVIDKSRKVIDKSRKALVKKDKVIDKSRKALVESKKALDAKDKVIAKMARQLEESRRRRRIK